MYLDDRRIRIITGHYGSGKTEFAVNYTVNLAKLTDRKVAIADLDIVNLYFRSREKRDELEAQGIKVIYSTIHEKMADLPAIAPEIVTPVKDKSYEYIIDLGGNDVGTAVLGRLKPILDHKEVDFFMVVNTNRPDTANAEGILRHKDMIEAASGLKVTGFINNTNMIRETTEETILEGDRILQEVVRITGVPVKYTTYVAEVTGDLVSSLEKKVTGDVLPLKFYMREDWM